MFTLSAAFALTVGAKATLIGIAFVVLFEIICSIKKYKSRNEITNPNWHFLSGDSEYIMNLANKGFYIQAGKDAKSQGGFGHSGQFALIDKEGNIRCRKDQHGNPILYYDGLEAKGVKAIIEDIKKLINE